MSNSNVQHLSDKTERHTVRMMAQSPHGGIVAERRAENFLVVNVNAVINGETTGCATLAFDGDLPTPAELRDGDMMIEGTWGWHVKYGGRFDVEALGAGRTSEPTT